MKEFASGERARRARAIAEEAALDDEAYESSAATEPAVRALVGLTGLAAGIGGATVVAVATVTERWIRVPALYAGPREATLHLALEIVCGAALWLVLWTCINAGFALDRELPVQARRPVRAAVVVCSGLGVAAFLFTFVVERSARMQWTTPGAWRVLLGAAGIGICFAAATTLRVRVRRSGLVGSGFLVAALALHVYGLERYIRHYGNVQTILLIAIGAFAALGCGLVFGTARRRVLLARFAWCAMATSALWVALLGSEPSQSARRAVLVWGGVAKRTMLSVVWPLCDRDGDGSPALFWGADPNDHRADVTPRSGLPTSSPSTVEPLGATRTKGAGRNLLWIIVDTVRRDSFDEALAANATTRAAFAPFADHRNYISCSSRTSQVTAQLYGESRCDARGVPGWPGRSLLTFLRSEGYHDRLLSVPVLPLPFSEREVLPDDTTLLARAADVMAHAQGLQALFLHLRGGHAEYLASGATPRDRYEHQLRASLAGVAHLVSAADPEHWAVVVLGDHGEAFGEHLSFAHATTLYDEALRTPLLVRAPNVSPGPREEQMSCATVPWLALHGLGLIDREPPLLQHQYSALDIAPGELGHLQGDRLRSLRVGHRKVIWSSDLGLWEYYDLESDPAELHSLADSRPSEFAPLRATLEELSQKCPPERTAAAAHDH